MEVDGHKDTIFGYEIPMPASDIYIALATVAAFLPALVVGHNLALFIWRVYCRITRKRAVER